MALGASTVWSCNASATAGNVNGGGFNTANANMLTDLTTDSNTANTNSPVVSSATYNFVAGDVGAYVYIKSGTNWTPGFYLIASVASNKATLSAAIGEASQYSSTYNRYIPNTVAGCATVGTPTSGTFGVDYSPLTTAKISAVADFNAVGASTTLTSATAGFTPVMVGNIFHQTTTGTGGFGIVGWYEIVSYTNATTVVLDRTPNTGTASVNTTGYVGGAMSFNSTLDDDFLEAVIGGNFIFYKNGSYTVGEAISVASTSSTITAPIIVIGYNTVRGDNPTPFGTSSSAPTISAGTNTFTVGQFWQLEFIIVTATASTSLTIGTQSVLRFCKLINTSTTAGRSALTVGASTLIYGCEFVSQFGVGISVAANDVQIHGCYIHDCSTGLSSISTRHRFNHNLITTCRTAGFSLTSGTPILANNTIYGYNTQRGTGVSITALQVHMLNNIVANCTTGVSNSVLSPSGLSNYNVYYNNTTAASSYVLGTADIVGTNPNFVSISELTGSTATTSGSVLTQSGGDFSTVTDNVDYLQIHSGTGVTVGSYLITAHTSTTVTLNVAPGTNATADKVWTIQIGKNFGIGTAVRATAYPGTFDGTATIGYLDPGAVQRKEPSAIKRVGHSGGLIA
jgi:hypothetical protein